MLTNLNLFIKYLILLFIIRYLLDLINYKKKLKVKSIVYFYMKDCPYCDNFNPIWDKFTKTYKGKVKIQKYERSKVINKLKKYNIESFPTIIKIYEDGTFQKFNDNRTIKNLNKFIKN